jgi:hypothetical protein
MRKSSLAFVVVVFFFIGLHWTARHEAKPNKTLLSIDMKYVKPELLVGVPPIVASVLLTPVSEERGMVIYCPNVQGGCRGAIIARESMHPV